MGAHFELCQCGKHGRIIQSDIPGLEVTSKEEIYILMSMAESSGRINRADCKSILTAIEKSGLPTTIKEVDPQIEKVVSDWNGRRYDLSILGQDETPFYDTSKIH